MSCEIKVHIGCGTVYLKGYINVHPIPDYKVPFSLETLERNITIVDKYYKDDFDNRPKKTIADVAVPLLGDIESLREHLSSHMFQQDVKSEFVDEICMFHVLEHIPQYELDISMKEISAMLKPGGRFRVAVPDFDAITLEFAEKLTNNCSEKDKDWYYRYVYGTQKDKWSHHYCGYNRYRLIELLKKYGFDKFKDLPNQNCYSAVHLMAYKEEIGKKQLELKF